MSKQNYGIKEVWQVDEKTLGITWTDGVENRYDVVELRRNCPCASCVDEMTGVRTLKREDVPEDTRPKSIDSVGRYAMAFQFSDGHNTGIYSFDLLRKLANTGSSTV